MQYRQKYLQPTVVRQPGAPFSAQFPLRRVAFCFAMILVLLATLAYGQTAATGTSSKTGNPGATSTTQVGSGSADRPARPAHIVPFGPPAPRQRPRAAGGVPVIPYWGGPVISNIHVVEVFWGSFVDAGSTNGLQQFFTDVTNSTYFDQLNEYSTLGLTGQGGGPRKQSGHWPWRF